ncbi:serine hydrolase domain-containing protein [Danxiaibacter flavus]|uniref:Serine hydrolase domain-containing protein n=1 Tax=Danxiaibacter flavus TaxID=3049108 RepID=A0ABV3Z858_9BACT|nr:serine hydrolase domain-containing protein [Chitinophagaceae bacterium DXS]
MKQLALLFSLVLAALVAFSQNEAPQQFSQSTNPEQDGFSESRLRRIDSLMQYFVDAGIAPNAITFVARKGKIVQYKAYGYSSLEKKTPAKTDDIYRIASQTKLVVTVGLLTLFEQGKFVLDDPISKYIPEFRQPKVLVSYDTATGKYETRPAASEITIRHLLSHTAGIPYDHPLQKLDPFNSIPYFGSTKPDVLAEVVKKIAARPLIADPGEKFVYGLNTDVLGYLIEVLSKQPLDVFLKEKVLQPLGMNDTYFYLPENKARRLVELYSKNNPADKLTVNSNNDYRNFSISGARTYFSGGAGIVSTIRDYANLCQMILNKGSFNHAQILGRKTVEMMEKNQIGDLEVWDRKDKFGLGLQIITAESHYGDNASPGSLTWGGMYCSEYTIDTKEDLILLVYTNIQPFAQYGEFVKKFRNVVYQALK